MTPTLAAAFAALASIVGLCTLARADQPSPTPSRAPVRTTAPSDYTTIRADQNWSFLAAPANRTDTFDRLEYLQLADRANWFLSLGGEIREANESIGYDQWGANPRENSYLLQRYLFIADAHLGSRLRLFLELKSGVENGRIGGANPVQADWLDALGAFVEIGLGPTSAGPSVRIGTQELALGSQRLVAPRYGPNVQQSFTGARFQGDTGSVRVNVLAVRPDTDVDRTFANYPAGSTSLWGIYAAAKPSAGKPEFDAYYLGIQRADDKIARGSGAEVRHTVGARMSRAFDAARTGLDFDDELMYQFGTFAGHPIVAWSAATASGWHFGPSPRSPRLLVKADIASGDDPSGKTVGTFDPYFPSGSYFGIMATTGPGAVNFVDAHPAVSSTLGAVTITADWLWYWRQRTTDGLYSVPGSLLRLPAGSHAHFVGERPGIEVLWHVDRHLYLQADYAIFSAGPYIHESGPASALLYRSIWLGYKF
jgi:hypothetical protein